MWLVPMFFVCYQKHLWSWALRTHDWLPLWVIMTSISFWLPLWHCSSMRVKCPCNFPPVWYPLSCSVWTQSSLSVVHTHWQDQITTYIVQGMVISPTITFTYCSSITFDIVVYMIYSNEEEPLSCISYSPNKLKIHIFHLLWM